METDFHNKNYSRTVAPSGHPRGNAKWPLKRGYSEIGTENSEKVWQKHQQDEFILLQTVRFESCDKCST